MAQWINPPQLNQPNVISGNRSSQELHRPNNTTGVPFKSDNVNATIPGAGNPDQNPSKGGPNEPAVGFYSARAVDILRDNPRASPMAPKFDPHAESPSIRKTAGIDHMKSVPVSRKMLFGTAQSPVVPGIGGGGGGAAAATAGPGGVSSATGRNFINPSSDIHRRLGAPGGNNTNGPVSPANKGFTTSSFRPLTRPVVDNRNPANAPNIALVNPTATTTTTTNNSTNNPDTTRTSASATHDLSLKRAPLNDVTNASVPGSVPGGGDIKRPRLSNDGGSHSIAAPPPPQAPR